MSHSQAGRIHYLDNLRIFCMAFGVYVHAVALGDYPLIEEVVGLTSVFRMEIFFLVSGFFVALVSEKRGLRTLLRQRVVFIGLPFLFTLVLVNPITIYISNGYNSGTEYGSYSLQDAYSNILNARFGGPELHLWFLLILLIYIFLFAFLKGPAKSLATWCEERSHSLVLSPLLFAFAYALLRSTTALSTRIFEYPRLTFPFIEDAPYFAVGVLAAYSPRVMSKTRNLTPALALLGILGWSIAEFYSGPGWSEVTLFGRGLLSVALVVSIIWFFSKFCTSTSDLVQNLSSSIYTVYLFHQSFLYLAVYSLGLYYGDLNRWVMLVLATCVLISGVVFHNFVIQRSAVLTLMFSGKGRLVTRLRGASSQSVGT